MSKLTATRRSIGYYLIGFMGTTVLVSIAAIAGPVFDAVYEPSATRQLERLASYISPMFRLFYLRAVWEIATTFRRPSNFIGFYLFSTVPILVPIFAFLFDGPPSLWVEVLVRGGGLLIYLIAVWTIFVNLRQIESTRTTGPA